MPIIISYTRERQISVKIARKYENASDYYGAMICSERDSFSATAICPLSSEP